MEPDTTVDDDLEGDSAATSVADRSALTSTSQDAVTATINAAQIRVEKLASQEKTGQEDLSNDLVQTLAIFSGAFGLAVTLGRLPAALWIIFVPALAVYIWRV